MRRSTAVLFSIVFSLLALLLFLSLPHSVALANLSATAKAPQETAVSNTETQPVHLLYPPYDPALLTESDSTQTAVPTTTDPLSTYADKTAVLHPTNNLPLDWWRQQSQQTNNQQPATNYQSPATNYQYTVSNFATPKQEEPATYYQPQTNQPPIINYYQPTTNNQRPAANLRAPTALYTSTLQPLHRATGYPGFSSSFAFTNTGVTTVTYDINFYWLNGDYVGSDNGFLLSPGQRLDYYMDSASIGETTFVGIAEITGDEPLTAQITSPDYGIIQGTVYEDDGVTPAWVYNTSSNSAPPDWQNYGNTYNLSDGRFYLGGMPDNDYILWIQAPYPWASQWYNQHMYGDDADWLTISGAGTISVAVVLQPGGRITGTVYADDGVTPLPNINVDLEPGGYGTCTDANGRYLIEGLPYGEHIIRAAGDWNFCQGHDSIYLTTYYSNTHDYNLATPILITGTTDSVTGINFQIQEGGIITGQVLDDGTGLPISNVPVNANEYDNGWYGRGGWTDASGVYTITGLLSGDYRVAVEDSNNIPIGYTRQYYDHHTDWDQADRVAVTQGSTNANINFDLLPGGAFSGTVYANDGITPLANINVDIGAGNYGACTDGNGRYLLNGLPLGDYQIVAGGGWNWCLGQNSEYLREYYDNTNDPNTAVTFTLDISNTLYTNIDFTLDLGGSISGTVYADDGITPLQNINVDVEGGGYGACTDENGHYAMHGLPYNDYYVRAGGDWNFCLGQDSIYLTTYYSNTHDYNLATPIPISSTALTASGIDFNLQQGGVITGRVLDNDTGLPIANVNVGASEYDNGQFGYGAWTDPNGYYTITGMLDAEYRVSVDSSYGLPLGYARQFYDHQPYHHLADRVPVSLGGGITNINFDLLPGGAFSGTVYADDGVTPLANINVDTADGGYGTCTDENGRYYMNGLPFGDHKIIAGGGWNWCLNQNSDYIREYYPETIDPNAATIFTLDADHLLYTDIDFTLSTGGSITGHVTDASSGDPLEGVRVNVREFASDNYVSEGYSDASGVYTVTGLFDGDFRVAVDDTDSIPDGYAFQYYQGALDWNLATPVNVSGSGTTGGIDFPLEPGGIITGQVVDQNTGLPIANTKVDVNADNWGWGTCTDDNGYYVHRALPYGDYRVSSGGDWDWCQEQQSEYGQEFYNEKRYWDEADILTLDGGSTPITDINFTLEKGGFLAGHVSDDIAQPVENLRMVAVQGSGDCPWCENHVADTYTDAAGNYVIGPIPPGDYTVLADTDQNGQLLVREYYNDVYDLSAATFVSVTSEMTTPGLDFILDPGVWLTGHITVPPGYSNEGIWVNAWKTDGIWYGTNRATDASGNYILPVPPIYDSYWGVSAYPDGPDLMYKWAHQFDLAQHTNWDFDLGFSGTITGCITDGGMPIANLWVNADSGEMNHGNQTDENGCYTITNLPPSTNGYEIRVDDWESGRMWTSYGGHDWGWQTRLPLAEGDVIGGFDFEVPWRGQIEGYVYESDGTTPIEGLRVVAVNENGFWEGYSQPDGYFTIDAPAGEHRLMFAGDYIPVAYYPDSSVHQYADATPIMVSPLPTTTMVTMNIERTATVHGQITDSGSGDPLGGILVAVRNIDPAVNRDVASSGCTDENGNYYLEGVWAGDSLMEAIGTCGNWDYGLVTDTLTVAANSDHEVNLQMTAGTMPERPFTIKTNDTFNYNALSSGGNTFWDAQFNAEQILAALYEPLVGLDDDGNWTSELLTQVPTLD
ncbi:MAG: carboxypeptidase regulatory-like domain-containing protein, partial [Anaerolineales bacterium]|nr:carboxypeptidase regulatory-like domain-containing protein [Anaerolineales bacterium]